MEPIVVSVAHPTLEQTRQVSRPPAEVAATEWKRTDIQARRALDASLENARNSGEYNIDNQE